MKVIKITTIQNNPGDLKRGEDIVLIVKRAIFTLSVKSLRKGT